ILESARKESSSPKKERLLSLGKIMVDSITQARDAEKAMEEAKQAARKAEVAYALCKKSGWRISEKLWDVFKTMKDIDWPGLTTGPEGVALAESIRDFIHDKFQSVQLPRFIRSVEVHSFEFGDKAPVVELKDLGDPLPEFYEDDSSNGEEVGDDDGDGVMGGELEGRRSDTEPGSSTRKDGHNNYKTPAPS
ncbi:MAG: hypothetical protein Q9192_008807, partial [Flavoplaca navasiana]